MLLLANRPYIRNLISRDRSYSKDLSSVKHKPAQSWNTCLVFVYHLKIANIALSFCNIFLPSLVCDYQGGFALVQMVCLSEVLGTKLTPTE